MPDVSLPWANLLYNFSNLLLVTGAVLVLIGTIGTVWMGLVKENYGDLRIAANEALTAAANQVAASANASAAQLTSDAAEARLEQERIRQQNLLLESEIRKLGPRVTKLEPSVLAPEQLSSIKFKLSQRLGHLKLVLDGSHPASRKIAGQIDEIFKAAGWSVNTSEVIGMRSITTQTGIVLYPKNIMALSDLENVVVDAFRSAQIEVDVEAGILLYPASESNTVQLFVTISLN